MNVISTLIGFVVFMVLFIGGAFVGGEYLAIGGFIAGVVAFAAIAMGKVRLPKREDLRDQPGTF